ncbi:histidine phosphatase family protein [Anabaena subtropica]|uniref:Histidine phosphatase family protein n=1 Tax=Anabaena subtropica FACHB-260 TaxID=2692884 RepID=A0ABR8CR68_9NOST|nr:histidine phosphatase family protein [Anabaena subtropica]MBD2345534.1 histidine phosphatase family protein [Anabaena subtropica FACHB-260]
MFNQQQSKHYALVGGYILTAIAFLTGCNSAPSEPTSDNTKTLETTAQPVAGTEQMSEGEKANADFQDKLSGKALLNALKQGGHIIYFRHTQTEKDYADQVKAVMGDCSTQRMLSEVGWKQARTIGEGFRKYAIPVDQVISSQYCRAWQTADLAFGKYEKNANLNFPKAEDYSPEQTSQMKAQLTPMLTAVPTKGTNTVIVGHDDLFEAATGIYPDPQGMAYIVKPDGKGSFELVANLLPEEWAKLE